MKLPKLTAICSFIFLNLAAVFALQVAIGLASYYLDSIHVTHWIVDVILGIINCIGILIISWLVWELFLVTNTNNQEKFKSKIIIVKRNDNPTKEHPIKLKYKNLKIHVWLSLGITDNWIISIKNSRTCQIAFLSGQDSLIVRLNSNDRHTQHLLIAPVERKSSFPIHTSPNYYQYVKDEGLIYYNLVIEITGLR